MITSPRAKLPVPGGSIPDAAREGANALVRSFARELAPFNIAVNAIVHELLCKRNVLSESPGSSTTLEGRAFVARIVPLGRLGRPAGRSLGVVRFLAATNARFMTGSILDFTGAGRYHRCPLNRLHQALRRIATSWVVPKRAPPSGHDECAVS